MKQKFLLLALALLGCMNVAQAKDGVTSIQDATIMQGGFGCITIKCKMEDRRYNALQIEFVLPEGLHFNQGVSDYSLTGIGDPRFVMNDKKTGKDEGVFIFMNMDGQNMKNGEYDVVKIYFQADESMEVSEEPIPITITALSLSGEDGADYSPFSNVEEHQIDAPTSFNVKIVEPTPRVIDEEAEVFEGSYTYEYREVTEIKNEQTGKTEYEFGPKETVTVPEDVIVKRTIKKNTWSTLCLPFALSNNQKRQIFGSDVQLAQIPESSDDEGIIIDNNNIEFNLKMLRTSGIDAYKPYFIKSSQDISEIASPEKCIVENKEIKSTINYFDEETEETQKIEFVGVLNKQIIPKRGIFLSGNKFYYSTGDSEIKGFRGYFMLDDYMQNIIWESGSGLNIGIVIDGELTAIEGISTNYRNNDDVYSVSGVYMGKASDIKKLSRGIYIVNGKKVIVK